MAWVAVGSFIVSYERTHPGGLLAQRMALVAVPSPSVDTARAMSQENVEIVRRYYEAYAQGGFDPWMEYWSDDLDHRPAKDGIDDPGPIRGKNAMRKHIGDWIDTFDDSGSRRWN